MSTLKTQDQRTITLSQMDYLPILMKGTGSFWSLGLRSRSVSPGCRSGPFALWHEIPFAAVGLFQAYLIMFVVGVALWFGSSLESDLWKWDLIGLLAYIPPRVVNFINVLPKFCTTLFQMNAGFLMLMGDVVSILDYLGYRTVT